MTGAIFTITDWEDKATGGASPKYRQHRLCTSTAKWAKTAGARSIVVENAIHTGKWNANVLR